MANISKVKIPGNSSAFLLIDTNGRLMIATNYQTGVAYNAGEYIIYNDALYRVYLPISAALNNAFTNVNTHAASIGGELKAARNLIASEYLSTNSYSAGDYFIWNNSLYRADENISAGGLWAEKSTQVTVGSELKAIKTAMSTGIHYRGVTTTELSDGATTNPITINGSSYTAVAGDLVIYGSQEFLWDGSQWDEFGSTGTLKAMAFADTASGSFTASGTAAAQTFTGTQATISISGSVSGTAVTMTPGDGNKVSITPFASGGSFTQGTDSFTQGEDSFTQGEDTFSAGSMPTFTVGSNDETLTITAGTTPTFTQGTDSFSQGSDSFSQGSDTFVAATGGSAQTVLKSLPTPSVTQGTFSGSTTYTPAGTNGQSSVSVSGSVTVSPDNAS